MASTFVIENNCEAIIPAYLAKPVGPIVGLLDSIQEFQNKCHLVAASIVVLPDEDSRVTFRVLNLTNAPVLLHKGSSVGKFSVTLLSAYQVQI